VPRKKKPKPDAPPPAYPLPEGVELTSDGQEDWARLTRLLPFNEGPRLLFVLVEPPLLRRRLADHLAAALGADGYPVARLDFTVPYYQPLQEIFDAADGHPEARFCFLFGLERSLLSPEHRVSALTDLNFHRDQISRRLACPLVTWTTDDTFTDLVINTPDFIAWRGGVFHLTDPAFVVEGPYRQHVRDLHGKLTLYSVTSDAPLAVDLERVFVKLTATQRRMADGRWPMANDEPGSEIRNPKSEILQETTVTLSVSEALRAHPCLSIIGAPGSGKTTLLKYLALTFARHQAQERLELDEERLPVFIALRDFNRFLEKAAQREERLDHTNPSLLPRFLHEHFRATAPHLDLPEDFFARQLEKAAAPCCWTAWMKSPIPPSVPASPQPWPPSFVTTRATASLSPPARAATRAKRSSGWLCSAPIVPSATLTMTTWPSSPAVGTPPSPSTNWATTRPPATKPPRPRRTCCAPSALTSA
jgi:hypothetical protein